MDAAQGHEGEQSGAFDQRPQSVRLTLPEDERVYWNSTLDSGGWTTLGPADSDHPVVPGTGIITLSTG
ncbi:hypothetical protein [Streptomyces ziwulingensis]|uniref:hypothetical protein n=1 Tax=Streptomyces ziwulingensis TaxID=1045501 RepID=UPI0031EB3F3E